MCGIIGGNSFSSTKRVVKGLHSMMHRGTDGNVILKFDSGNHLSHNRLSIQDLSEKANQPMVSDCGNYYLAFNGELWKSTFKKFNKKLRKKYNFKTEKSDSELLLYFLVENIDNLAESLNKIEGMFCFSFYDFKNDTTYLGRDFIGRLPLYYCYQDGKFAYSSEVKGLTIGINKSYYKIDVKSKRFKSSEFKDREVIHAVLPGTVLKFSPDKFIADNHSMTSTRWFDFKPKFDEICDF